MEIEIGKSLSIDQVVTAELTAMTVGSGDMAVYATPMMIALMEKSAATLLAVFLETEKTSVGIEISTTHIKATKVGVVVKATATIVAVDGRAVDFSIIAHDQDGAELGRGNHRRFIVDRKKFEAANC